MEVDTDTQAILSEFQKAQSKRPLRGPPSNRLLDGMSSSLTRKIDTLTPSELIDLKERNEKLLNNPSLIITLPDKGAKLRASVEQIDALLQRQDIAGGLSNMSIDATTDLRKRSLDEANALADKHEVSSSLLGTGEPQSKTRMMRMDESMKLQEAQQQQFKDDKVRRQLEAMKPKRPATSESLADDLSLSLTQMNLNPELGPHRPADDNPDEYEEDSEDQDSIDEANYDSMYEDDEGFDEEEYERN